MNFLQFLKERELNFVAEYSPIAKTSKDIYSKNIDNLKNKIFKLNESEGIWKLKKILVTLYKSLEKQALIAIVSPRNETPFVIKKLKNLLQSKNTVLYTNWNYGQATNKTITFSEYKQPGLKTPDCYIVLSPEKNIRVVEEVTLTKAPIIGISVANMNLNLLSQYLHLNLIGPLNIIRFFIILDYALIKNRCK